MLTICRRRFGTLAICLITLFSTPAVFAQTLYDFNLPSQALADSLRAIGHQTSVNILFDPHSVEKLTAPPVHGQFSASQAVNRVLAGTNLAAEQTEANTLLVEPKDKASKAQTPATLNGPPGDVRGDSQKEAGNKSSQGFRVAQLDQGATARSSTISQQDERRSDLTEIIVTAQKRTERLQDVPVPVTAVEAQALVDSNQLRLQDYFTRIPGVNVTPDEQLGSPQVTIRGISTGGYTSPTVGIVVDDVPYGSSTIGGWGSLAPDVDPFDLARVEVLRGPQGTLYGAASMGGLIKFVTADPSTDAISGRVQAGTSTVYNGAQLGYNLRGAINVPLNDTLALRASGFTRIDPGYIDNPIQHVTGINRTDTQGGLLAALWKPSDVVSLKLSALLQDSNRHGYNDVDAEPGLGDLQQNALRGTGSLETKIEAYSANLKAKLGGIDLTAITAYNVSQLSWSQDFSPYYGALTQSLPQFGVSGSAGLGGSRTDKFSQELRLSASIGPKFDWLVGAFYTYETSVEHNNIVARDPLTGDDLGTTFSIDSPATFAEAAAFADLTVHISQRFDLQIGGRESQNRRKVNETDAGPFTPLLDGSNSPFIYPRADSKSDAFTYLVTPRYKVSDDLMLYARIASGYRPGGPNTSTAGIHVPPEYGADKTENYEVGAKGSLLDRALTFDASVYYIDWRDIQVLSFDPSTGAGYLVNGNRAKSQGVELSLETRPFKSLTLDAWIAWDDAVLTEPFPLSTPSVGLAGDRLPYSARFSGNVSADEQFGLGGGVVGYVGGSVSYFGEREGDFPSIFAETSQRQILPAYAQTDLRAGTKYNTWRINLFVNNVADKRGLLRGGIATVFPFAFNYIQPRTAGLSVEKAF